MPQSPGQGSLVQPLRRWDPDRIGPYLIIGRLGAGAMGQVFLAQSTAGRLVAVKTIRVELAEEPGFRARFGREVAAARRVSGVFTASVIEADPEADLPWVATAYVPAPSLSMLVQRAGPLPVPAVRWLAAGCAEALASIHGAGLLHRDVKPSNVLVAPDGPRVIDFGVARASERVQLTATRGAAGTPAYMAPEQARDATRASPASDVFSLGATLVYAATGHAPYQGETVMDILVRLATEPPDLDGLPAELADLVNACLERVPRERPTDDAILGRLGSFALPAAGAGHVYLPQAAMTVIAEYQAVAEFQHQPRRAAEVFGADGILDSDRDSAGSATNDSGASIVTDVTDGSQTPLPGFESPGALPAGAVPAGALPAGALPAEAVPQAGAVPSAGQSGPAAVLVPAGQSEPLTGAVRGPAGVRAPSRRRNWREDGVRAWLTQRALLPFWARLLFVVVFIALGIAIGQALRLADPPAASGTPAAARATASQTRPDGGPGPGATPPALCATRQPAGTPGLCVSQPLGDGDTTFVIHGTGFRPFTPVTVTLAGAGSAVGHAVTDMQGTFNYAIDQEHRFFSGLIPPGSYRVTVTARDEPPVGAAFQVNSQAAAPPP